MNLFLDTRSIDHYRLFLRIKSLPRYAFQGHTAIIPDEYASLLGETLPPISAASYVPEPFLWDYQAAVTSLAIRKERFAAFIRCGLGKTAILLSYARYVHSLNLDNCVLIVSPLSVCAQTITEAKRFWGEDYPLTQVRAKNLQGWLETGSGIGITNYEAIREGLRPGKLACLVLDESSALKSHYGAWAQRLIELGRGLRWKLCCTGTPAPNDRIEFANHAVFLDQFPTVNSFLARYFVNRGQTGERWELKPHALRPFYRSLSHWAIFLEDPSTYGWHDNVQAIPPIHVHYHDVPMTNEQQQAVAKVSGSLIALPGGITKRSKLSQLAKGRVDGKEIASNKAAYIRDLVDSWRNEESTIIWCRYNHEQDELEAMLPQAASIRGTTKEAKRQQLIADFQSGKVCELITKPDVLGFGMNFQIATRHIFNGLWDSAEEYHQAVSRSNRVGSTRALNVHIPLTEIEWPMAESVFAKLKRMQQDSLEQEQIFKGELLC